MSRSGGGWRSSPTSDGNMVVVVLLFVVLVVVMILTIFGIFSISIVIFATSIISIYIDIATH